MSLGTPVVQGTLRIYTKEINIPFFFPLMIIRNIVVLLSLLMSVVFCSCRITTLCKNGVLLTTWNLTLVKQLFSISQKNQYIGNIPECKGRPARKADNLTAI
jgi:hypothetical protein